ncbi:MAG: N-acetyl-D-myo-inositol-2-amino-2-deoxy-alpha-D-glucopyranoside deacetylase, partial [Pseudonocardiales bacterium]|nr:N-acetyl-D-myo-inositol-2-amino-2-deoxy-alpha-D-glucopyranoside deacetylase [Pseudonocardiales bacterium]
DGQRAEQVAALAEILAEVQPQVVVGYDPGGSYGHPDHVRAHEITMAAAAAAPSVRKVYWTVQPLGDLAAGLAELAGAPARGMPWRLPGADELPSVPDETVTTRVEVTDQLAAKVAALRAHATQLTVWSRPSAPEGAGPTGIEQLAFALTNEIAMPVLRTESYTLAGAAGSVQPVRETDLFDGIEAW